MAGAAGSLVGGLIGGPIGAAVGGLAGSGISNLVGGGGASTQPAAQPVSTAQGQFQSYTPQAQQQQDYTFQGLQNQLRDLAWSGLKSLPGGVTPTTQLYPQVSGITQGLAAPGQMAGAYGPYGDPALGQDLWSLNALQTLYGGPQSLLNYGQAAGSAGLAQIPYVQQAAFSPQIAQAVQNVIGNPFLQQQLAGAQTGAGIGGQAAGMTPDQIALLNQLGQQQAGWGAGLAAQAQGLVPGLQQLGATGGGLTGAAPGLAQQAAATSTGLPAAQQQILQTGLDPQGALFNQLSQQTRDQANAINAMSGLAGTPYAAGLTNDAMRNFNIQWQNQQLARQAQADQAAAALAGQQLAGITGGANILGGLTQQGANIGLGAAQQQLAALVGAGGIFNQAAAGAGNLFGGGLNLGQSGMQLAAQAGGLPAGVFNQQQQAALNALQMQNQLTGGGVTNLANLTNLLGAAGQQPIAGVQALNQLAAQPYTTAAQQAQNAMAALQNQVNFANPLLQAPQDVIRNSLLYMGLGQNAANLAGNLGQQSFLQNQQQLQGLGALGQLGTSALFGNQGLLGGGGSSGTGLLGGQGLFSTGGLFGSQGPLFGTAADISIAGGSPPLALALG